MSVRVRKGLSYVLGDGTNSENHILPINSIQYSSINNKLYTASRDGIVKQWNTEAAPGDTHETFEFASDGTDQDLDEKVLKLETSISSNPLPSSAIQHQYNALSSYNYNIHFDWINDIKLVNNDQQLISCSSDLSMKIIDLNHFSNQTLSDSLSSFDTSNKTHRFPNIHTDYVKKLSYITPENLIVSGGLDGKIVVWDINTLKSVSQLQNISSNSSLPSSVYSLANNYSNLIGAGGPNNIINLFDRRTNLGSIKKLIGHQDNIRCLLMNENFVLSGSSDTTIKLWDLRNFKVYKNFEIHDDAVWSLTTALDSNPSLYSSSASNFKIFYSGDKNGNIIKTDLSYHSNNVPHDSFSGDLNLSSNDMVTIDEKLGISTLVSKSDSPVLSLCVESNEHEESSLFASNYMSLDRYYVPNTDMLSKYQYLRTCLDHSINYHENANNDELTAGLIDGGTGSDSNDLNSDFYDIVSHLSMDTNNLDIQSTFSGNNYPLSINNPSANTTNNPNADDSSYTSMFLNVDGGGPSMEFVNTYKEDLWNGNLGHQNPNPSTAAETNDTIDKTPIEILLNPIPVDLIELIPFNKEPLNKFQLTPKSIISKRLFNNKRWMLVLYLNGDIQIWDILICKPIKSFPFKSNGKESVTPMMKQDIEKRSKEMDVIFQEYQTNDTLTNWCEVEIKAGRLLVTLNESSFNNVEIYYDELIEQYPFLDVKHVDNLEIAENKKIKITNDDRHQVSRILINSLFHNYSLFEWEFDKRLREELRTYKKSIKEQHPVDKGDNDSLGLNDDASLSTGQLTPSKRMRMFSRKSSKNNVPQLPKSSGSNSPVISAVDASTGDASSLIETTIDETELADRINGFKEISDISGPANEDSIMKLLQFNKRRYMEKYDSSGKNPKLADSVLKLYTNIPRLNDQYKEEEFEFYKPLINSNRLPSNLLIIIFENSSELGNYRDVCSFHFEDLLKLSNASTSASTSLINDLRNHLPKWIGQPILYDRFPIKECPKIAFQLLEVEYALLPIDKKIGGKVQRKIKRLPVLESSIKLSSHNMLRVSKIICYLTEKFDSRTAEMKDHKAPTDWLVLQCKGEELANNMTLQTIKTKIWKSSSDIELRFRRKFDS